MKKLLIVIAGFSIISCSSGGGKISDKAHIGKWSGLDSDGKQVNIELKEGNKAVLDLGPGEEPLDDDFVVNDVHYELIYFIDYNQKPIQLDLILKQKDSDTKETWEGIAEFTNESNFKLCSNFKPNDTNRFKSMEETTPKDCITLKKQ